MYNMILSKDNIKKYFKFIVLNIAFLKKSGRFTGGLILKHLENIGIEADMERLNSIFERWLDDGLIFEDANRYVVNLGTV